jgi:hypothetical protein
MNICQLPSRGLRKARYLAKLPFRLGCKYVKPYYSICQQSFNDGIYAVEIRSDLGFFAQLNWCLYIFSHCESYNLRPYLILSGMNYRDKNAGNNWFDYFFENRQLSYNDRRRIKEKGINISTIKNVNELKLGRKYDSCLTLERALSLFNRYVVIKQEILGKVADFEREVFGGRRIVGVHYRGTDKSGEAPRVPWDVCINAIKEYLSRYPETDAVFVSSDEEPFIEYVCHEINKVPVLFHQDQFRSSDGSKIHVTGTNGSNYLKGEEALINSLLLSKCQTVIRTSSFLSAWSSVFNPEMKVILLNRPYNQMLWFPECDIIRRCAIY